MPSGTRASRPIRVQARRAPRVRVGTAAVAAIEKGFADGVADRVSRGPFTFSDRAALLRAGEQLGLDRFRANLIVAEQQHRMRAVRRPVPVRRRTGGAAAAVVAAVMVQVAVVAIAMWAWTA